MGSLSLAEYLPRMCYPLCLRPRIPPKETLNATFWLDTQHFPVCVCCIFLFTHSRSSKHTHVFSSGDQDQMTVEQRDVGVIPDVSHIMLTEEKEDFQW